MVPMARVAGNVGKLAAEALYQYALRALARRPHTVAELQAKLGRRCADEADVRGVIDKLRGHGYVDDERTAESYSEFRRDYAALGKNRVLNELRQRGVEDGTAEKVVANAYEDADEAELARNFLRRKLGERFDGTKITDRRELARLYAALARAGFAPHAIADALRGVSADFEVLDALSESIATE